MRVKKIRAEVWLEVQKKVSCSRWSEDNLTRSWILSCKCSAVPFSECAEKKNVGARPSERGPERYPSRSRAGGAKGILLQVERRQPDKMVDLVLRRSRELRTLLRGPQKEGQNVFRGYSTESGTGNAVGQDSSGDTLVKAERALCV
jgi:hypothetical protein